MYADEYARFSGGSGDQFSNMLNMSKAPPGLVPFNVKMPRYQSRFKGRSKSFSVPKVRLPAAGTVINVAVIGAVCFVGIKLFKMFGSSMQDKKDDAGQAALDKTYVSNSQAKADSLTTLIGSLNSQGYSVSSVHQNLANTIHDLLDSNWVDHDKVIQIIKSESKQTFQLVATAYGTRDLNTYLNSPFHVFNASNWGLGSVFSAGKAVGTLKDALVYVLTSSEQSTISEWLNSI